MTFDIFPLNFVYSQWYQYSRTTGIHRLPSRANLYNGIGSRLSVLTQPEILGGRVIIEKRSYSACAIRSVYTALQVFEASRDRLISQSPSDRVTDYQVDYLNHQMIAHIFFYHFC